MTANTATLPQAVPFDLHCAVLRVFLAERATVVARIEQLLNAQKLPVEAQQDVRALGAEFKACFYSLAVLDDAQRATRDELERAHWASGFQPRAKPGNDILDAATLLVRGFHCWRQTRWPGQKGRLRYANTLFNVYVVRCLALLVMRVWDDAASAALVAARLAQVQALLDALWQGSPAELPALVRDARWLLPIAMSPTTDELGGYFDIAAKVAATFGSADKLEAQRANVVTGGGHLRSQLRHLAVLKGVPLEDPSLALITRVSNALDVAMLMEGLVPLLVAYEAAVQAQDAGQRKALASAICQGLSPDPELYINRLDLLGPYTMIEHLFIAVEGDGQAQLTATGQRHLQLLQDYCALVARLAAPLLDDCRRCTPVPGGYSPYGALYGFSSNLPELLAFKTLQLDADVHFCMEDVFTDGDANKRAWVNGWRNLPHVPAAVVKQFEYPEDFAMAVHVRIERALVERVAKGTPPPAGTIYVGVEGAEPAADVPILATDYVVASDPHWVESGRAAAKDEGDLLFCRLEGEFVVSFATPHGWVGLTKDLLTEVLGAGQSAKVVGVPREAAAVLALMCPQCVVAGR